MLFSFVCYDICHIICCIYNTRDSQLYIYLYLGNEWKGLFRTYLNDTILKNFYKKIAATFSWYTNLIIQGSNPNSLRNSS